MPLTPSSQPRRSGGGPAPELPRVVVIGAGELGGRVARAWVARGGPCLAVTRTENRHADLRAAGVEPALAADLVLASDDRVLLSVAGSAGQASALAALEAGVVPRRLVVVGTTGIHGGRHLHALGPDSPTGTTPRAGAAALVEARAGAWAADASIVVRCGGLYCPGRGPFAAYKRRGEAPRGRSGASLALVHYDDAASAVLAALMVVEPRPVYLCVTPPCPTRAEFYAAAAASLGWSPPDLGPAEGQPTVFDVEALRSDLLPQPAWPDWYAALV